MDTAFPPRITTPAARALEQAGIASAVDLAQWSDDDLLALHGVGPKTVEILRDFLDTERTGPRPVEEATREAVADVAAVDAYLASADPPQREALGALRDTLRSLLPHADECLKYGVPAFAVGGKGIAGYGAYKAHCTYFPMSGSVLEKAGDVIAGYSTSKGGLRFGLDERLPITLLRLLIRLRLDEFAAVTDGKRSEYYDDGQLKAEGSMRSGQLHGHWQWFRRDGSLMRTGQFSEGEQIGTWTTYDQAGDPIKVTRF